MPRLLVGLRRGAGRFQSGHRIAVRNAEKTTAGDSSPISEKTGQQAGLCYPLPVYLSAMRGHGACEQLCREGDPILGITLQDPRPDWKQEDVRVWHTARLHPGMA